MDYIIVCNPNKSLILPDSVQLSPEKYKIGALGYNLHLSVKTDSSPVGIKCSLIAQNSYLDGYWISVLDYIVTTPLGKDSGRFPTVQYHSIVTADNPSISLTSRSAIGYIILHFKQKYKDSEDQH